MMSAQSLASFCCSRKKALVLLRLQPLNRAARRCAASAPSSRAPLARRTCVHRDQPPQRGVDAAQVPEVGIAAARDRRTWGSGRSAPATPPARRRLATAPCFERRHAAAAHRQHADRGVAPEDARVAPRLGGLRRGLAARMPCGVRHASSNRTDSCAQRSISSSSERAARCCSSDAFLRTRSARAA